MTDQWQRLPVFSRNEVQARFEAGLQLFLYAESKLFAARIGEIAMYSHLARYLEKPFAPWDSDPNYDASGDVRKRSPIPSRKKNKHPQGHLVTPDIIIHRRLHPLENLLAIEAKSEDDRRGTAKDREKLKSYQGPPLCYPYVVVLILSATKIPYCRYELFDGGENPQIEKPAITLSGAAFRK